MPNDRPTAWHPPAAPPPFPPAPPGPNAVRPRAMWIVVIWGLAAVVIAGTIVSVLITIWTAGREAAPTRTFASAERVDVQLDVADIPAVYVADADPSAVRCDVFSAANRLRLARPESAAPAVDDSAVWDAAFTIDVTAAGTYQLVCLGDGAARFGVGDYVPIDSVITTVARALVVMLTVVVAGVAGTGVLLKKRRSARGRPVNPGLLVVPVAWALFAWFAVVGPLASYEAMETAKREAAPGRAFTSGQVIEVAVDPAERQVLYATGADVRDVRCEVVGSRTSEVMFHAGSRYMASGQRGEAWKGVFELVARSPGTVPIRCTGPDVVFGLGRPDDPAIWPLLGGASAPFLAFVGAVASTLYALVARRHA
jgi:hypothetical protein